MFDNPYVLSFLAALIGVVLIWLTIKVTKMLMKLVLIAALVGVVIFIFRDKLPMGEFSDFLKENVEQAVPKAEVVEESE